jgi:lysine-N-methylase
LPEKSPALAGYAGRFRCIGPACEDTCCQGWNVPIDQPAWEKYQSLPESPLRTEINSSILIAPAAAAGAKPAAFASLQMNEANQCPLLTEDRLCRVHKELGEGFLSYTCATYPRIPRSVDGIAESALALSCPEAARVVLLSPELETLCGPEALERADSAAGAARDEASPQTWFWPIHDAVVALIRNRAYPIWQRLFLLGMLCRRLDAIWQGALEQSVPEFLCGFEATVASGSLRAAMDSLPSDRAAQLDVVLRLAGMMLHRSNITPRFVECIQAFTAGIGNGPGSTLESLAAHASWAYMHHYAPFFEQRPYILENYLINLVVRHQFPFGREAMRDGVKPAMTRESVLLTAQFALIKGLLIGVAGFHRESFSAEHVVHTVQAASKHFEHHPEFLELAYQLLVGSGMDGARGIAILARNDGPGDRGTPDAAPRVPESRLFESGPSLPGSAG